MKKFNNNGQLAYGPLALQLPGPAHGKRHKAPKMLPDQPVPARNKRTPLLATVWEPTFHEMSQSECARHPERCFPLTAESFARVNPNTGTAPIFRTRRDAELTTAIYERLPVLVNRSSGEAAKAWPVKYTTMFHMTNDSYLFRTRTELEEKEGAWPVGGNCFDSPSGEWLPLYEGKMVQAFDHRAASIVVNPANVHRPAQPAPATVEQHCDPSWRRTFVSTTCG